MNRDSKGAKFVKQYDFEHLGEIWVKIAQFLDILLKMNQKLDNFCIIWWIIFVLLTLCEPQDIYVTRFLALDVGAVIPK